MSNIQICARTADEKKAASVLASELSARMHCGISVSEEVVLPCIELRTNTDTDGDGFSVVIDRTHIILYGSRLRSFFFAAGLFLRKTEYNNGTCRIVSDFSGLYRPDKEIRGHQIGYRTTPNTYDAWDYAAYERYYIDLLYYGCNTVEHIPYEKAVSRRNRLMRYDEEEFLVHASAMADDYDLDVSLWFPNCESDAEQAVSRRKKVFSSLKRLDAVFVPGGDPGELEPDELFDRCRAFRRVLKESHPEAKLWISAQQPHTMPLWGEEFIAQAESAVDAMDGVIYGPNHAFPIDEMRRRLPAKYPMRFYPDITHNVRCEYPVHFDRDDWHYVLTTGLSRECINPRPAEYALLHGLTRGYVVGSVSYSEGVSDDINKFVWSCLDWNPNLSLREILEDYARLFFPETDIGKAVDLIFALEKNWEGNPTDNPSIAYSLYLAEELNKAYPVLQDNWRFNSLLFRARCDNILRDRVFFEESLIGKAVPLLKKGAWTEAETVLSEPFPDSYIQLRASVSSLAETLFRQIGLQLDTEHYAADSWERGATLETIDLPVTDRAWLLQKCRIASEKTMQDGIAFISRVLNRNTVGTDEFYFSFALHGFAPLCEKQKPEFYMDFQGDRPHVNNGSLPVCMFKIFDHFHLQCALTGFSPDTDYVLQMTFRNTDYPVSRHFKVETDDTVIYEGKPFGGYHNEAFEEELLPEGYSAICYDLPASVFRNGCLHLTVSEPLIGFMCSEFRIIKKNSRLFS